MCHRISTYLILSVLVYSLLFIKSLQTTIMSLVQLPSFVHRNPKTIRLIHNMVKSLDCTFQQRGVSYIRSNSFSFDKLSSLGYFFLSLGGKRAIVPSCKFILEVPSGLSVPYKNECVLVGNLECWYNTVGGNVSKHYDVRLVFL